MMNLRTLALISLICLAPAAAQASFIVYGTHTDHSLAPNASLSDVRLMADLQVSGGLAVMTLTNASVSPEHSASFKEIIIDTTDDDTGVSVFWNPVILTDTKDVSYSIAKKSNGLPGYHSITSDNPLELQASKPPSKKGLNPNEVMQVQFNTNLNDGAGINDYLAFFGGGNDTSAGALGFHAISADAVRGESLSGTITTTNVPEPTAAALLAVGGIVAVVRKRRRS